MGVRARVAAAVVLATVAATVAMAVAAYQIHSRDTRDRFVAAAYTGFRSDARQAADWIAGRDDGPGRAKGVAEYMSGRLGVEWVVVDTADGTVVGGPPERWPPVSRTDQIPGVLPAVLLDRARRGVTIRDGATWVAGGPGLAVAGPVDGDLVLVEFYDTRKLDAALTRLQRQLAVIAAVVALLAAVSGAVLAGRVLRPVRRAAEAARRFGSGALGVRLPVRGRDELADLATAFNAMAERLGRSIEELRAKDRQQRRFVADVAHDLRTPVATMVAATDSLDGPDGVARDRATVLLGAQARRLARLVEDLLEMSRFDAGAAEVRLELVDLRALVEDAVRIAAPGAVVGVHAAGETTVTGDPRRLHTIACNLLSNAVCHGAEPVTVTIAEPDAGHVTLAVADSGPGLPDDLVPVVFDRFVRGDHARRATGGSGLGLAIANENALLHGGSLRVDHTDTGGAVFTLTLPRRAAGEDGEGDTTAQRPQGVAALSPDRLPARGDVGQVWKPNGG